MVSSFPSFPSNRRRAGRVLATVAAVALATPLVAAPLATPLVAAPAATAAPGAGGAPTGAVRAPAAPLRLDGIGPLVDSVLARQLTERGLPGAGVAVVHAGRIVHAKGYGYADIARTSAVDARRTLFRTGSAGKLFTWTGVMQLVEQGRLDLHQDVNAYLDFAIPDTYPGRPVTLHHLLTHSAGFEDRASGLFIRDAGDLQPLGRYLAGTVPARVRPPGEVTGYSNFGAALAGYIVERTAGVPYEAYLEDNIFRPLGMSRSTARQPLPAGLAADMATGYSNSAGGNRPEPFEVLQGVPAGAHAATVTDMARFMLAHLGDGRYDDGRILQPATVARMHQRQFANHPDLPGMAYGFYEQAWNGQRMIAHGGDTNWFHTDLVLLPGHGLGVYVAYNGVDAPGGPERVGAREELVRALLDRYLPNRPGGAPTAAAGDVQRFVGSYVSTRSNHTTVEKIGSLGQVTVSAGTGGRLETPAAAGSDPARDKAVWEPVAPLVFREVGGQALLAFREGGDGRIVYLFSSATPIEGAAKVSWWQDARLQLVVTGVSAGILALTLLVWPVGALVLRRRRGRGRIGPGARRARWVAWATCLTAVAVVAGVFVVLSDFANHLLYGISPLTRVVTGLGLVLLAATVVLGGTAVVVWVKRLWWLPGRIGYSVVTAAAVTLVAVLGFYNLIGFNY